MSNLNYCPVCGANNCEIKKYPKETQLDFFQKVSFEYDSLVCNECGFNGEANSNESSYALSFKKAKKLSDKSIVKILVDANRQKGIKDNDFERSFSLPPRTLNRWKSGENSPSASAMALLKLVNTFDFLVDVADAGYEPETAIDILRKVALYTIKKDRETLNEDRVSAEFIFSCGEKVTVQAEISPAKSIVEENSSYKTFGFEDYTQAEPLKYGTGG